MDQKLHFFLVAFFRFFSLWLSSFCIEAIKGLCLGSGGLSSRRGGEAIAEEKLEAGDFPGEEALEEATVAVADEAAER